MDETKARGLLVNIYELGMIREKITRWRTRHKNNVTDNEDISNAVDSIKIHLLLITNDKELDETDFRGMDFDEIFQLLVKKHFEYLKKFNEELLSSL